MPCTLTRTLTLTLILNYPYRDLYTYQYPVSPISTFTLSVTLTISVILTLRPYEPAGNDPSLFSNSYRKFLETQLRKSLGFQGTPIRLLFRARRVQERASRGRGALNDD